MVIKKVKAAVEKKSKAGRKTKPPEEKVAMVPVYAKKMHHEVLAAKFQPLIKKEEAKLDKEVKQ